MAGILDLIVVIAALVILWVVVSIPVYIAARVVTSRRTEKATFGEAMVATLGGAIVYVIVLYGSTYFLNVLIGSDAFVIALILAFIAWLAVYKGAFEVGWVGAIGIAILAAIVLFVMSLILVAILGVTLPSFFHPF